MSYNPWPLVIVALGSLGFLANSMAQNNNRFENPGFDNADRRFSDFQIDADLQAEGRVARTAPAPDTAPELEPFEQFENRSRGFDRQPEIRRSDAPRIKITDVQPAARIEQTGSPFVPRSEVESAWPDSRLPFDSKLEPRVAQNNRRRDAGDLPTVDFGARQRSNAATRTRNPSITPEDIDSAYLDRDFRATMPTSVSKDSKDLISTQEINPSVDVPLRQTKKEPSASGLGSVFKSGQEKLENAIQGASQPQSVPLWLTLGLFISLPANLFFGWIAMTMHARCQDLLEDMQASDSRLTRESRRRRSRVDDREERRDRTSHRERDEDAFLHGGIEV